MLNLSLVVGPRDVGFNCERLIIGKKIIVKKKTIVHQFK